MLFRDQVTRVYLKIVGVVVFAIFMLLCIISLASTVKQCSVALERDGLKHHIIEIWEGKGHDNNR